MCVHDLEQVAGGDASASAVAALADDDYHTLRERLEAQALGFSPLQGSRPGLSLRSRLCEELHSFLSFVVGEERRR